MYTQLETTIIYSILLAIVSVVAGFTGYTIKQSNEDLMTYLNAVSTGVILAAAFTHLLPDSIEDLKQFQYPVATACALAGFLLLVVVETVMQQLHFNMEHTLAYEEHTQHDCSTHNYEAGAPPVHTRKGSLKSSAFSTLQTQALDSSSEMCETEALMLQTTKYGSSLTHEVREKSPSLEISPILTHGAPHDHSHSHAHSHAGHSHAVVSNGKGTITVSGAIAFWVALMVHSTLEGFGVGVTSSVEQFTIVFAILIHKGFESLALSSALLDSGMKWPLYVTLYIIFCFTIPAGAILGSILQSGENNSTFSGVITGLAAGSFMYIGTMEMLPNTLSSCKNLAVGMTLFIGSAVIMAGLAGCV